ncbi:MAG: sensor histidine kinase, partial [Bacteroidetes bacterium]|nr:sensor histidine kinase [Bacteroidota bacterium]
IIIGVWIINNSYSQLIRSAENKRNFLLSITHELKSPIASAKLGLQTIQKRKLNEDQTERISVNAQHELDRLKNLVDNLLLAAKVETNYNPVFEMENVARLINEYVQRLTTSYPDVDFCLDLDSDDQSAEIDRSGFISILDNLVENAIKYSEPPVQVRIATKMTEDRLEIIVADRGVGIPESEKQSVFEKFYRVGSEDTRKTKGTGLGLYIIKEMTSAHQGDILVEDNPDGGTIFKVRFPRFQK